MDASIIEGTKAAPECWGDVLILGLGKSGKAAASYCLNLLGGRVNSLTIAAGEKNDSALEFAAACEARGARVFFDLFTFEKHYDVCIASPGISQFSRFYENASAASGEMISEVEFAWRESPAESRWVAVTGTNGKTTTTSLITHILKCAGEWPPWATSATPASRPWAIARRTCTCARRARSSWPAAACSRPMSRCY